MREEHTTVLYRTISDGPIIELLLTLIKDSLPAFVIINFDVNLGYFLSLLNHLVASDFAQLNFALRNVGLPQIQRLVSLTGSYALRFVDPLQ